MKEERIAEILARHAGDGPHREVEADNGIPPLTVGELREIIAERQRYLEKWLAAEEARCDLAARLSAEPAP